MTSLSIFPFLLFFGMLLCVEIGRRIGLSLIKQDAEDTHKGIGAIEGAVFGLLGLLVAFTFSGAALRFDERRSMITVEANAIGTAYLRTGLLPEEAQPEIRNLFRQYLDKRLETYSKVPDMVAVMACYAQSQKLQQTIWDKSLTACNHENASSDACKLLLPALNDMIDVTATRLTMTESHPPGIIFILLGSMSLVSAFLGGYSLSLSKTRKTIHMILFAAIMSLTVFVIFDLEYPRLGFIKIDAADHVLIDVRKNMQ